MSHAVKYLKYLFYLGIVGFLLLISIISYFLFQLPDDSILKEYKPNVMTRVHASNGDLVKEYAREYRIFIPIDDIPDDLREHFKKLAGIIK